jgi:hypothetical protein
MKEYHPRLDTREENCKKLAVADGPFCAKQMGWPIGYIGDQKV